MTGMKEGAGEDPFDSVDAKESTDEMTDDTDPMTTDTDAESETQAQYPYVLRRQSVHEGRDNQHVAHLRDKYADAESKMREEVADLLGVDEVPKADFREALWALGQRETAQIAEILSGWGYEHRGD